MDIRCVTFDWGDTLGANHGMPYRFSQRRALEGLAADLSAAGAVLPSGWLEASLAELEHHWRWTVDPVANPDGRECDMAGLLAAWIDAAGAAACPPQAVARARDRYLRRSTDIVRPYGGAAAALAAVKAAGYRVGILSHVAWPGEACRAWFARWGMAESIDFYSFSSEVGWIKPNPRHYAHAQARAGCAAAQILHVGDHPERDVTGAHTFGLRTCLRLTDNIYDPATQQSCAPDAMIANVDEIPDVLQDLAAPRMAGA